jgi:hypothetical protein
MIKSENIHKDRISNDLITDCKAAKRICDALCLAFDDTDLTGFIQKIDLEPFGLLLISDLQVCFKVMFTCLSVNFTFK